MAFVGHTWRARSNKIDEYRRVHATVGAELEDLLRSAGITEYVIYACGDVLFSHMEVEDYEQAVARLGESDVAQRWEVEMAELIEYPKGDATTGWPRVLDQVWSLGSSA
ncbi:MAG: L-rhamnose mutarotase [Actinobacteria bacterium]|nr:L-rhamnose mutarotase [Actinomycetota bacterium]